MQIMGLPEDFVSSLEGLPGLSDPAELCDALQGSPPVSVRFNPYKLAAKPEGRQTPWCRYGFMLDERPQFTLDPLFHGGAYYVQEASSMFVEHIYRRTMPEDTTVRVLDLCAAPGGKATLLSTLAGLESIVVANEVSRPRAMALADNVRKWGLGNVVVTNNDPSHFAGHREYFDFVLVDAPCSGEGMFRKDPGARAEWSPGNVKLCAQRQRRILADVWDCLKPGGVLAYSTCTFNTQENDENIEWLASQYDAADAGIGIDEDWGVVKGDAGGIGTFRFYPHRVEGEGFFAAAVRKGGGKVRTRFPKPRRSVISELPRAALTEVKQWAGQPEYMHAAGVADNNIYLYYAAAYPDTRMLAETLSVVYSGVMAGQLFGGKLRPAHPLALFHDLNREIVPEAPLDTEDALRYLRRQDTDPSVLEEGINLVSYGGLPIGWIKRVGNRSNNMYPKELRIYNL